MEVFPSVQIPGGVLLGGEAACERLLPGIAGLQGQQYAL